MVWLGGIAAAFASTGGFGRLEGVVTSPVDGRGLPNVDVIVRVDPEGPGAASQAVAEPQMAKTDRTGSFHFDELPPGLYALDVLGRVPGLPAPGYVWTHLSPVVVAPGVTSTEQIVLAPVVVLPPSPPAPKDT